MPVSRRALSRSLVAREPAPTVFSGISCSFQPRQPTLVQHWEAFAYPEETPKRGVRPERFAPPRTARVFPAR